MLFNSLIFLIFFPIVTAFYFLLPHRFRWSLLLVASCIFYMAYIPAYLLILLVTILVDYAAGIYIERTEGKRKRIGLIVSLVATGAILFIFKYFNFFNSNLADMAEHFHWNYSLKTLEIALPIGLSFHTFQSMSYVIEVYLGRQKAERHFGRYALYVMFYPQLVAGPIERPQHLLHQFVEEHHFDYVRVVDGLKLMAWGFFKKVFIADKIAAFINPIYADATGSTAPMLMTATYLFAFQIFCDFSGYTDIARGAARVMGFELMENFKDPYASRSIPEFWQRWHISLSTWFRDYLYIPMGGSRVSMGRWVFNIFVVFLVSGMWHGANWTFMVWGLLHGGYYLASSVTASLRAHGVRKFGLERAPWLLNGLRIFCTFNLVSFSWIFFRSPNLATAIQITKKIFLHLGGLALHPTRLWQVSQVIYIPNKFGRPRLIFVGIAVLLLVHALQKKVSLSRTITNLPLPLRWAVYIGVTLTIVHFGELGAQDFIYFRF